jgi:hypothetical protein
MGFLRREVENASKRRASRAKKSPARAGLLERFESQMMWVTINAMTTTTGTPNNHRMTGIVASAA